MSKTKDKIVAPRNEVGRKIVDTYARQSETVLKTVKTGSVDCNDLKTTGSYAVDGNINTPTGNATRWNIFVAGSESSGVMQFASYYSSTSERMWMRYYRSGAWTKWQSIATAEEVALNDSLQPSINITTNSGTYYYLGREVNGTISGTATVILTHCSGTINVTGGNAKVYITNSPNLIVQNPMSDPSNRLNIFIDGVAEYRSYWELTYTGDSLGAVYYFDDIRPLKSDYVSMHVDCGFGSTTIFTDYDKDKNKGENFFVAGWANSSSDRAQGWYRFDDGRSASSYGLEGYTPVRYPTHLSNYIIRRKA